ncbi:hypothetical protein [Cryobacterium adonitolivorans]|uniref:hypothetical protein n=1 Tax=Cryobacterium adonitolivorans TaxID=1259189 RepID=UPI0018E0C285|nr:hypothetical protein [Cryobacterium adonitolivorans]
MAKNLATSTTAFLPDLLDFVRPRHRMLLATTSPIATGGFPADVAARLDAQ